jgi:hypothetical protein
MEALLLVQAGAKHHPLLHLTLLTTFFSKDSNTPNICGVAAVCLLNAQVEGQMLRP